MHYFVNFSNSELTDRNKRGIIGSFVNNVFNKPIQTIICRRDTFRCTSGFNCITYDLVCNGIADCSDSSDESPQICNKKCPQDYFQCRQGSCILDSLKCNGIADCPDQSDELNCTQKTDDSKSCQLPKYPANGKWIVAGKSVLHPGDLISYLTAIQFICDEGYVLKDPESGIQVCTKDSWLKRNVQCIPDVNRKQNQTKTCPAVKTNQHTEIYCELKGKVTDCNGSEDGTTLHYKCKDFYVDANDVSEGVLYCKDGSWDEEIPQCIPSTI